MNRMGCSGALAAVCAPGPRHPATATNTSAAIPVRMKALIMSSVRLSAIDLENLSKTSVRRLPPLSRKGQIDVRLSSTAGRGRQENTPI
jgi:hypothetical protein